MVGIDVLIVGIDPLIAVISAPNPVTWVGDAGNLPTDPSNRWLPGVGCRCRKAKRRVPKAAGSARVWGSGYGEGGSRWKNGKRRSHHERPLQHDACQGLTARNLVAT